MRQPSTVESQSLARAGLVLSGRKNYAFARAGLTFARGRRYEHVHTTNPEAFVPRGSIEAELGDVKEICVGGGYGRACGGRGGGEQRRGGRRVKSNQRGVRSGESTVESTESVRREYGHYNARA